MNSPKLKTAYVFVGTTVESGAFPDGCRIVRYGPPLTYTEANFAQPKDYAHFWQNYDKVDLQTMMRIRQKADRITEDFHRRFTGEFYAPIEFAAKGLEYLEKEIGKEWWSSGEYRFWDMAAGTGNLEFNLPSSALPYCYISTLDEDDAKCCKKIFPAATCFQYDYLGDDISHLAGKMAYGEQPKMPANLAADLANPSLKWIIFINPPFATANTAVGETGKTSKTTVAKTTIREWMTEENYGEVSRDSALAGRNAAAYARKV